MYPYLTVDGTNVHKNRQTESYEMKFNWYCFILKIEYFLKSRPTILLQISVEEKIYSFFRFRPPHFTDRSTMYNYTPAWPWDLIRKGCGNHKNISYDGNDLSFFHLRYVKYLHKSFWTVLKLRLYIVIIFRFVRRSSRLVGLKSLTLCPYVTLFSCSLTLSKY